MKTVLIITTAATLGLYLLLSVAFDTLQKDSKAGAVQVETQLNQISK